MPLVVCATPIGNLEDITLRVLAELRAADVVFCEDTRHTRGLLDRHGIDARVLSYHEHNEASRTSAELVPRLQAGERIALVSDAGMPGVSDPGGRIVSAALDGGRGGDGAAGALGGRDRARRVRPRRRALSVRRLSPARCEGPDGAVGGAARLAVAGVAFESPHRLPATLRSLAAADPVRQVAVCRELTKRFEEVVRGTAAELAEWARGAAEG